jgi:tetratricopeptide (TPR) repeat protein
MTATSRSRALPAGGAANLALIAVALAIPASTGPEPLSAQEAREASLGRVDFGVSCAPAVRADFDRAVALLHHMTYPVAYAAFEGVAETDPECAIAYWGMAVTLFQPLWPTRPSAQELELGWRLARQAQAAGTASVREAGFVAAAVAFFDPAGDPDYWTRIDRWAEAHARLLEAFPDDLEVRAFYALSHLATASRSGPPADHHARAADVLAGILQREPTHPGAVHYTIHADDFDGRQAESPGVVRSYAEIAPSNPHALHMPTHIFVRLGEWDDVIAWNRRAAEAALAQRVGPNDEYVWDEYPHAVEYMVYAYLQEGDDRAALGAIEELRAMADLQPSFKTASHLATTPARYALERWFWDAAAALAPRAPVFLEWDAFPWPEAIVWHARGVGRARRGDRAGAARSLSRIEELERSASAAGERLFADQIRILGLEVEAWLAADAGERDRAVALMSDAAALEERTPKHPVTPGATVPAREMLGDLLATLGDQRAALAAYRAADERTPGRLNAALGLARAHAALGETGPAAEQYRRVLDLAVEGAERSAVEEAQAFLGPGR